MSYRLQKQTADTAEISGPSSPQHSSSQSHLCSAGFQSNSQYSTTSTALLDFSLSVRSTREGKIVQVDIDYESRQPIHTPAYHTSEQSTLQTPDSLCLDPHTTLANTYDNFRVTTYDLQLPSFLLGLTTTSSLSLSSISLSSQPTLTAISELRLTTYDLRLPSWDPSPPPTNNHQQPHSIC